MDTVRLKLINERNINSEVKWIPDGFHFLGHEDSLQRKKILDKVYQFFDERGYLNHVIYQAKKFLQASI